MDSRKVYRSYTGTAARLMITLLFMMKLLNPFFSFSEFYQKPMIRMRILQKVYFVHLLFEFVREAFESYEAQILQIGLFYSARHRRKI